MSKKNKKATKPVEEVEEQVTEPTVVVENSEETVIEPTEEQTIEEPVPEVKDEEELLNEFTSPENIENLEKELNEEYANTQGKEEEKAPEDLIDLGVAQEVIDKFGDVNQRLNDIVNNTKPDDLQETLQEELNQASAIEDKLKKRIDELEKKIPPKTRSNLNARMTNLWCGVRYT